MKLETYFDRHEFVIRTRPKITEYYWETIENLHLFLSDVYGEHTIASWLKDIGTIPFWCKISDIVEVRIPGRICEEEYEILESCILKILELV